MGMQRFPALLGLVAALLFAAVLSAVPHRAEASPAAKWRYSELYNFSFCSPCTDVNVPSSGVVLDPRSGSLLGTACGGGVNDAGGVFELLPGLGKRKEKVLTDFTVVDPDCPTTANLLLFRPPPGAKLGQPAGETVFFGTTPGDGEGDCGMVFELSHTASGWQRTVVHHFQNDGDGCAPSGGLIEDAQGHLYGTTFAAYGTVFELVNNGSGWVLDTLYRFSGDDGDGPTGSLLLDQGGNLYGTTLYGGSEDCGTVYELSSAQILSVLHEFCTLPENADGYFPTGGVIMDGAGALYGVTYGNNGAYPAGTVYKLMPHGAFETLYTFCSAADCTDGANPYQGVVMDQSGNLYGTTYFGGAHGYGTVFELTAGGEETLLHSFTLYESSYPIAPLILDKAGHLLGTTTSPGGVFELTRGARR